MKTKRKCDNIVYKNCLLIKKGNCSYLSGLEKRAQREKDRETEDKTSATPLAQALCQRQLSRQSCVQRTALRLRRSCGSRARFPNSSRLRVAAVAEEHAARATGIAVEQPRAARQGQGMAAAATAGWVPRVVLQLLPGNVGSMAAAGRRQCPLSEGKRRSTGSSQR